MNSIETIGAELADDALALTARRGAPVTDRPSLEAAVITRQQIAEALDRVRAYFAPLKKNAYQLHRDICARENELTKPLESLDEDRRRAIAEFKSADDRRRADAEREQAEAEAKRRTDAALSEAAALEAAGEPAIAEAVLESAARAPLPVVALPSVLAGVDGLKFRRTWKWRYHGDPELAAALVPVAFKSVDEKKIDRYVKAMQGSGSIPGVDIYFEDLPIR